jgi:hypothetical protein
LGQFNVIKVGWCQVPKFGLKANFERLRLVRALSYFLFFVLLPLEAVTRRFNVQVLYPP